MNSRMIILRLLKKLRSEYVIKNTEMKQVYENCGRNLKGSQKSSHFTSDFSNSFLEEETQGEKFLTRLQLL